MPRTQTLLGYALFLAVCTTTLAVSPLQNLGSDPTLSDAYINQLDQAIAQSEASGPVCPAYERLKECFRRKADADCDGSLDEDEVKYIIGVGSIVSVTLFIFVVGSVGVSKCPRLLIHLLADCTKPDSLLRGKCIWP